MNDSDVDKINSIWNDKDKFMFASHEGKDIIHYLQTISLLKTEQTCTKCHNKWKWLVYKVNSKSLYQWKCSKKKWKHTETYHLYSNSIFENHRTKVEVLAFYALHIFPKGFNERDELAVIKKIFQCNFTINMLWKFKKSLRERIRRYMSEKWNRNPITTGASPEKVYVYYQWWDDSFFYLTCILGFYNYETKEIRLRVIEGNKANNDIVNAILDTWTDRQLNNVNVVTDSLPSDYQLFLNKKGIKLTHPSDDFIENNVFNSQHLINDITKMRILYNRSKRGRTSALQKQKEMIPRDNILAYIQGWLCYYSYIRNMKSLNIKDYVRQLYYIFRIEI